MEGNAAGALGCMMAGVTVVAWYPDHALVLVAGNADPGT